MIEKLKNKINDEQLKIRAISDEKITVKLTNNYAFQKIFKNTKIVKGFLMALLDLKEYEIKKIEITDPFTLGEYSYAAGSSAIIRYYCYIPYTSTLLQATACHTFHTLYVLSFLICYLFLPQIHYCNHMLQHFQLHLYLFLILQQNLLRA